MKRSKRFTLGLGLCAAFLAGPAAGGCGLDVNPGALDRDHNAELSRNETSGSALAGVFDRVDSNHDGVISQPEYINRCANLLASDNAGWEDTAAGKQARQRAEREKDRQSRRVSDRVDQETDRAADSVVDKAMGALFGH